MIPKKLEAGDEIRVISPVRSLAIVSKEARRIAEERLKSLGFKVTYSEHAEEKDDFNSSSINSRIEDMHEAFSDKNVKAVLTTLGGFNSNQLLRYIDYNLIKRNPKILCGFSDVTALQNAVYHKAGLVSYYGPHFSSFGMQKGFDYTLEYFRKCLMSSQPYNLLPTDKWSDDPWYKYQEKRKFIKNKGFLVITPGQVEGRIIGGNLCTFNLLQGTDFMPSLKDSILFIEDDSESKPHHFDRDLQSLIHQPGFERVRGMVIGRFEKESEMTDKLLMQIIKTKRELKNIPVIANADFGHTTPICTFAIGGKAEICSDSGNVKVKILEH